MEVMVSFADLSRFAVICQLQNQHLDMILACLQDQKLLSLMDNRIVAQESILYISIHVMIISNLVDLSRRI